MSYRNQFRILTALGVLALGSAALVEGGGTKVQAIDPNGRPKQFEAGELTGYAVWHSKKGWHIRTTARTKRHHFKGSIHTDDGTFVTAHGYNLEKSGKLADHWKMGPRRMTIRFDFATADGIDGIDFTVSKETRLVRFNLHIDGKHQPTHIFIGQKGKHPDDDPFNLVAHPPQKKKKKG